MMQKHKNNNFSEKPCCRVSPNGTSPKRVLFLCTGNSCRSQMAEALLRHSAGEEFEVFSAGTNPTEVSPMSIKVMQEIGVDISQYRSKSIDEFLGQNFDYVVTVCGNAKEGCPIFPGGYKKVHWDLKDPAEAQGTEEEKLAMFRDTRDEIKERISRFEA